MKKRGNISMKKFEALIIGLVIFVYSVFISGAAFCDNAAAMKGVSAMWPAEIYGWKIAEGPTLYDSKTAYKYMNGAAELFIAFNMRTLTVLQYGKSGQPSITLEIFNMDSSADAYGIFSFESDDPGAGVGQGSEFGGGLLRFWKGNYFVSVYGDKPGTAVEAATLSLGGKVSSAVKETGGLPKILALLPDKVSQYEKKQAWFLHSHILMNQRFFIAYENILKLSGNVDAALGQYVRGKDKAYLLVIRYPSQAIAADAFNSFKKAYMPGAAGMSVKTENGKWTAVEKRGEYLAVVFDAPDEKYAAQMIKSQTGRIGEVK